MNKEIFRDSLGQCNLHSNPYDPRMQADPRLIKHRQNAYVQSKDTLGSMQSRMEKEILIKILAGNFKSSKKTLLLIGKMGKYAFLAIVLPPYIFFYGIPKWLFTEALPKFQRFTAKAWRKVFEKISDAAHKGANAMKNAGRKLTSPILSFIRTRVEETRELFARIRKGVITMVGSPFQMMRERAAPLIAKLIDRYENTRDAYERFSKKFHLFRTKARRFFIYLPNTIADKAVDLFELLRDKLKELNPRLAKPFGPLIRRVQEFGEKLGNRLSKIMEATQQIAQSALDRVIYAPFRKLQVFSERVRKKSADLLEKMILPIKQWAEPKLQAIKKFRKRVQEAVERTKERVKEKTKELFEAATNRVAAIANAALEWIPEPVLSLFSPVIALFNQKDDRKKKTRLKAFVKKIGDKIHSGLKNSAKWSKKALIFTGKLISKALEKLKGVPSILFQKLKTLYLILKKILHMILTALKGVFLILRLMFAWMKALLRYGIMLLGEVTKERLRLRPKSLKE